MSWNYRVIYHKAGALTETSKIKWDEYLAIHEVYYEEEKISSITEKPISIIGDEGKESLKSIKWILEKITEALNKPIIDYDTLKEI